MKTRFFSLTALLLLMGTATAYANNDKNVVLYIKGAPQPNILVDNGFKSFPEAIQKFCSENTCVPTTQFTVVNPINNKPVAFLNVWGSNFLASGSTLCFTEIIKYHFFGDKKGDVYTIGDNGGTCGAFMDPALVKPVFNKSAVVVAGGGSGTGGIDVAGISHGIVGATGDFKYLMGGDYIDRVFVEFAADNATITFYNGLYFTLMPK